ncbi:hypothetical protein RF11_07484 [Thelohanellus kitauei]|uniref:Uncharacterized protein n=1 Tax=Thelohanellus kitauei TaxID=669202 RepID=A0A0C2JQ17_THEKT|nr:hypothetical protein RF11_07484 [Thelohanellus kitauei]
MRNMTSDYARIESYLFFVSGMISKAHFSVDFLEFVALILSIPPNGQSLLIKTCCRFLKDLVDRSNSQKLLYGLLPLDINSIYKWLARVSGPASHLIEYKRDSSGDELSGILTDIDVRVYLNSISIIY